MTTKQALEPAPTAYAVVFLGQLIPAAFVLAGLLTYEGLVLAYAIECLVLMGFNLTRAITDDSKDDGLLIAAMMRGGPVVLGLLLAYFLLQATPGDVLFAILNAALMLGNVIAAGRRSGRGMLDAAGDPTGSWWRMTLLAGAVVALFFLSSAHDMADGGLAGTDSFHGAGGFVAAAIINAANALHQPVEAIVALMFIAWKGVNETLFEAWSRAER